MFAFLPKTITVALDDGKVNIQPELYVKSYSYRGIFSDCQLDIWFTDVPGLCGLINLDKERACEGVMSYNAQDGFRFIIPEDSTVTITVDDPHAVKPP